MANWVKLCSLVDAPKTGQVVEAQVEGVGICLANVGGELAAVSNRCPHRGGPLGQGWLQGGSVVCPWHSWTFNLKTGVAEYPVHDGVAVFPLRMAGDDVLVEVEPGQEESKSEHS